MFARMLSTDTIRAHAKPLAAFAVLLVFAVAALPALAEQQGQAAPNVPAAPYDYGYGHMMWGGPGWGWHPFMIVGPIFVLLAIIGMMVIFVWLVRWATRGYPFYGHGHASTMSMVDAHVAAAPATAAPPSTFLMSASSRARSTRPSSRRSASCLAGKGRTTNGETP
jgi:uncharacterized membrane protein